VRDAVIVGYSRTPVGKFGGVFANRSAVELGGDAIKGALTSANLEASAVDYVAFGHVLQAGLGQITARQAAVHAGVGMDVPAETINKVCISSMTAVSRARDLIRLGECDVVVAGGMESMSRAPYVLDRARFGLRMGDATLVDVMMHDGLTCAFDGVSMGVATENYQKPRGISRAEQDEIAARSHALAHAAQQRGAFDREITAVTLPQRRGDDIVVTVDEAVRVETTVESLAALRPAFAADGTVTAGNASQISDGAAALIITSREHAEKLGVPVLAELTGWATVSGPDPSLLLQPANAIRAASSRLGVDPAAFDLYEINEAFASVVAASVADLGVSLDVVNANGGGIAMGHPIGASGARIIISLINQLTTRGGGTGAAALCGDGGQGEAVTVRVAG
jgi:acetyl-CoA C-acetyltransferase